MSELVEKYCKSCGIQTSNPIGIFSDGTVVCHKCFYICPSCKEKDKKIEELKKIAFSSRIVSDQQKEIKRLEGELQEKDKEIERLSKTCPMSKDGTCKDLPAMDKEIERLETAIKVKAHIESQRPDYEILFKQEMHRADKAESEIKRLEGIVFELVRDIFKCEPTAKRYCLKNYGIEVEI